jgi:uncharacterized repeat protein (TIGR04138 family)
VDRRTEDVLSRLARTDNRYSVDAYRFVFESLEYTLRKVVSRPGHVTGRELLDGIRLYALEQFGGLAPMVFGFWGVHETLDFGEIVFNLVGANLMGRTDQDTKEDFRDVFDFADAFAVHALLPRTKRVR